MATQTEVAAHLDMSDRHLRRLIEKGVIPSGKGHGGIDIDAARVAYIRYQRALTDGTAKPDTPPEADDDLDPQAEAKLTQERLRLTSAQAEAQELKNEVTRRRLVPVEFMTFALSKLAPAISSAFDTLPMTMRRRHPDLQPRHIDTLEREATKIRNACAAFADNLPVLMDEFLDCSD